MATSKCSSILTQHQHHAKTSSATARQAHIPTAHSGAPSRHIQTISPAKISKSTSSRQPAAPTSSSIRQLQWNRHTRRGTHIVTGRFRWRVLHPIRRRQISLCALATNPSSTPVGRVIRTAVGLRHLARLSAGWMWSGASIQRRQ